MTTVAIVGLGYVGLPLVVAFGRQLRTIGFDISTRKVESCERGVDPSRELADEELRSAGQAIYSSDPKVLGEADIVIVAVPRRSMERTTPTSRRSRGRARAWGAT